MLTDKPEWVYGATSSDGKTITLTPRGLNTGTVAHEVWHAINILNKTDVKSTTPEAFKRAMTPEEYARDVQGRQEVNAKYNAGKVLTEIRKKST